MITNVHIYTRKTGQFKWDPLDHQLYNLDTSPFDFNVFGLLKNHLKWKRINSDDELKDSVKDKASSRPQKLALNQRDRCAQAYGAQFE